MSSASSSSSSKAPTPFSKAFPNFKFPRRIDPSWDVSHIKGNASDEAKLVVFKPTAIFPFTNKEGAQRFSASVAERLELVEASFFSQKEAPEKKEAYVVYDITVEEDMLNGSGMMHGGCSAFLVDMCSSLALLVYAVEFQGKIQPSVSQSLSVVYHAPAPLGAQLRIANTTLTVGARAQSTRTEIWDITNNRLVSTGIHIKMNPSQPKL